MPISVFARTYIAYTSERRSALKHLFTAIAALEFTAFITTLQVAVLLFPQVIIEF